MIAVMSMIFFVNIDIEGEKIIIKKLKVGFFFPTF